MEAFKKKLEAIIDFGLKKSHKTWPQDHIKNLEEKYHIKLPECYSFYLQQYDNDYIREDYGFIPSKLLPNSSGPMLYVIDSIYGLDRDENNIENNVTLPQDRLPADLMPIADLPGGDLVCIGIRENKQNKIYFWFHEKMEENVCLVADSFENFIMNFKKIEVERNNVDPVRFNVSDKLNKVLKHASENMK